MSLQYVVEFDDLCDQVADKTLGVLEQVKEAYPEFKCTLFTIPRRTSSKTIARFKACGDWVELAPHGHDHTRGECLAWTPYEAMAKIKLAHEQGIDAPAFRAPAWLLDTATYEACQDLGYTVCDHKDYRCEWPDVMIYTYNSPEGRISKVRAVHGHLTDCRVDNHILDMAQDGRLTFAKGAGFLWPWDAAVPNRYLNPKEVVA